MPSIKLIRSSDSTGSASVATIQSARSAGATTLIVDTVDNFPSNFMGSMGTPHTFTDPVTNETITVISEATAVDFTGHVNSTNLEIDSIAPGFTDSGSEVGDIVIIKPTTEWANNVADTLAAEHNDDGTHNTAAATTIAASLPAGSITPAMRTGGFKIGTIPGSTFSTTGNKSITGVGFKPKLVRFTLMPTSSSTVMNMAHGAMTSTNQFYSAFLTNARMSGTDAAFGWLGSTTSLSLKFAYVSMDSDGFTINVSSAASAFDVSYEAYA